MGKAGHWLTRCTVLLALAFFCSAGPAAPVQAPAITIHQYKHVRWSVADGAPAAVYGLAQGPDGYIWIGSGDGLFRFDGVAFEAIAPDNPSDDTRRVSALLAARDGTVWVGFSGGAMGIYRAGKLRVDSTFPKIEAYMMNLAETRDGAVWAVMGRPDKALVRRVRGRWQEIGTDWGLPAEWVIDVTAARDGALWVTTLQSILVLREGTQRFVKVGTPVGHAAISEDSAGRVWLSDDRGTRQIEGPGLGDGPARVFATPKAPRSFRARFDAEGNLWAVNGEGLFRLRAPAARTPGDTEAAEQFKVADGLTSDTSVSLLTDREGNIWVGTSLGLDQFRQSKVIAEPNLGTPSGWGAALQEASDGSIYIGLKNIAYRVPPGGRPRIVARFKDAPEMACAGSNGSIWMILHERILLIQGDRATSFPRPPQPSAHGPTGCAVDSRGVLWVNRARDGLSSFASGKWTDYPPRPGDGWMVSIFPGPTGQPLALYRDDRLAYLDLQGQPVGVLAHPPASKTSVVYAGTGEVLLGGRLGLYRIWQGKLQLLPTSRYPWLASPAGIVATQAGEIWLIGPQGIVSLPGGMLRRAFADPGFTLRPRILDFNDGLPNRYQGDVIHAAAVGGDGRIWFSTLSDVAWVDPARLRPNAVPPPVAIRELAAGGTRYRDPAKVTLGRGVSKLSIQYAGLSFVVPGRVRFRYRLSGVDEGWIEAGGRRTAFYTNLGPGTYRFEVIAANDDGVWNEKGAALDFTIPPTFLQSIWFKLLCGFGAILLATLAYRYRVRRITAQLQSRFDTRIAERERIARELHDTLMQGFQGLMLRFQAVANRVPKRGGVRDDLDTALEQAETVLADGRARVRDLRRPTVERELADALRATDAAVGAPVVVTLEGTPRPLHPLVREEALSIGEEAIRNAVLHARASRITVSLHYAAHAFTLEVRDDGIGLPGQVRDSGRREGHFGLVGMRERAERIDGRLDLTSTPNGGTVVRLALSEHAAYANPGRRWFGRLW